MHSTDIIGHTYHADIYCKDCGGELPDIDPEGNEKGVIFAGTEFDYVPHCRACHEMIDGFNLTDDGVNHAFAEIYNAACDGIINDTVTSWAQILESDYLNQHMEYWQAALIRALAAEDGDAAKIIADANTSLIEVAVDADIHGRYTLQVFARRFADGLTPERRWLSDTDMADAVEAMRDGPDNENYDSAADILHYVTYQANTSKPYVFVNNGDILMYPAAVAWYVEL